MALNNATVTWGGSFESDLNAFKVYFSQTSGTWVLFIQTASSARSLLIPASNFNRDGIWYFTVTSIDTSGNESAKATPVSKRIVRTPSKLKVKK